MSLHQKMATHCFRSAILPRKTKNQNNLRFGHTGNVYTRKKMLLCCYHTTNTTDFIISTFFFPFFTIICYLISIFYTQGTGANWYIIIEALALPAPMAGGEVYPTIYKHSKPFSHKEKDKSKSSLFFLMVFDIFT